MSGDTAAPDNEDDTSSGTGGGSESSIDNLEDALKALESARKDAGKYRTRYAPYRDTFDGLDDDAITLVLDAVAGLKSGKTEGVTGWLDLGKKMATEQEFTDWIGGSPMTTTPDAKATADDAIEKAVEKEGSGETTADIAAIVAQAVATAMEAEREKTAEVNAQAAQKQEAQRLIDQAKALGYEEGSLEQEMLFSIAIKQELGSLEEAHAVYQERFAPKAAPVTEDPPPVPATTQEPSAGSIPEPEADAGMSAVDKLHARLDAALSDDL